MFFSHLENALKAKDLTKRFNKLQPALKNILNKLPSLVTRIFVGISFGSVSVLLLLFTSYYIFASFAGLIFLLILFEYSRLCTKKNISFLLISLILLSAIEISAFLFYACCELEKSYIWISKQLLLSIILLVLASFMRKKYLSFFYFALGNAWFLLPFIIFIVLLKFPNAKNLFLFLMIIIVVNDSGAYFIGKHFGKKKLIPSISPQKTYLGSFSGIIFSIGAGLLLNHYFQLFSIKETIIFSLLIAISAQTGDLLESKFKRVMNVKNTGSILLSHGGLLDRMDALLVCLIIYFYLLYYNFF